MVFFNHATRQMTTKIVYYGPGLCGKTTNLNTIYGRTSQKARGEMVSLNTETDRTLFFDLLPMDVGMVGGFKTKLQLYTVPGQVFYNSTRKLVLKGVDGIVFVADSQTPMLDANKESLQNLRDNLRELGLDIQDIPLVFQWNKRDLRNIVPVETLEAELNPDGRMSFQSVAQDGTGVFETLRGITRIALAQIKALHLADGARTAPAPPPPPPPAPVALDAASLQVPAEFRTPPPVSDATQTQGVSGARDTRGDAETSSGFAAPAPERGTQPVRAPGIQVMAPLRVKVSPQGAPPVPRVVIKPPTPRGTSPGLRPLPVPLPTRPAASRMLAHRVDLAPAVQDGDLEVVITVRQAGVEVGQATLHRPAPGHGGLEHLTLELKRS
ncbi:hypothetical protein METESE_22510 [Mesoterricola sediminis]|uniref:Uncharacterized protein n=1 Tax=Mesoterricola sediminis TaxID=2927980 RepID=A0AA48H7C0_9BACT|nr:GTPase domain-containing protein [Mesoterricola sediminis]BDU77293.1 hypothetical protein METESE_22510 [Mesoterricola sediminis]